MSFDSPSELQPYLLALTQMAQWHADDHQLPLELRFAVRKGAVGIIRTAITGDPETQAPASYTQLVTAAVMDLARTENFSGSFTVRINVTPGEQAIVKQMPLGANQAPQEAPAEPEEPRQTVILADGLHLRSALLKRGHTSGYSSDEITAEERKRGFTFPPALKFYRTLVREGVITQIDGQDVRASNLQADFGASALEAGANLHADFGASALGKVPWKAPATNAVQAVLSHQHWIEIAHSDTHLYAFDMAPGPDGTTGQIIARRIGDYSVPVRVAHSLAHFVTGETTNVPVAEKPAEAPQPETPFEKNVAWIGTVPPVALPSLLGWAEAPTNAQYRESHQERGGRVSASAKVDENDATTLLPTNPSSIPAVGVTTTEPIPPGESAAALFAGRPALNRQKPFLTADTEPIPMYELRPRRMANPSSRVGRNGAAPSAPGTPSMPSAPGASRRPRHSSRNPHTRQGRHRVADVVQFEDLNSIVESDIENLDSGIIYAPISPEQKNIATAIGTLAFGTKEEREEYRATDTSQIPTLDARGRKLSLSSIPPAKLADQDNDSKQADNNLRASLRKLFNGGNHV